MSLEEIIALLQGIGCELLENHVPLDVVTTDSK